LTGFPSLPLKLTGEWKWVFFKVEKWKFLPRFQVEVVVEV
jgi:hypothetical protein